MITVQVRKEYRGLNRMELLDEARELGINFAKVSHSCSQCVVASLHKLLEMDDTAVRVSASMAGGSALQMVGTCGALAGGIMTLDYFFGRPVEKMSYRKDIPADVDALFDTFKICAPLADRFWEEHGDIFCSHIQRRYYGRTFWAGEPKDLEIFFQKLEEAESRNDQRCCYVVVGKAAQWVMEILLDKGAVIPEPKK
jgi:C_GCAxxG_C_C family probable redox protein